MKNIHLCDDEKFINVAISNFEHYYEGQNVFVIHKKINYEEALNYVKDTSSTFFYDLSTNEALNFIEAKSDGEEKVNIIVHFLDERKARLINSLRGRINFRSFWIFYGADLYDVLYLKGRYELFDKNFLRNRLERKTRQIGRGAYSFLFHFQKNQEINRFIDSLNFFCFWNPYDYKLLKKNFKTSAEFREFGYGSALDLNSGFKEFKSRSEVILVNNSGHASGNHLTLLRKLNSEECKGVFSKLLVPLNYGNPNTIKTTHSYCTQNFGGKYEPMLNFLPEKKYFKKIEKVDIAFFGQLRQGGGANISHLLKLGAKVFLREQNNLLRYYRDLGVEIFSFEKDFNNCNDLKPLNERIQESNRNIVLKVFSDRNIKNMYKNLLN